MQRRGALQHPVAVSWTMNNVDMSTQDGGSAMEVSNGDRRHVLTLALHVLRNVDCVGVSQDTCASPTRHVVPLGPGVPACTFVLFAHRPSLILLQSTTKICIPQYRYNECNL